ncbi:hypothetical protein HAX54_028967 [Datura stramonium]|uniref:BHLH domain-containing protein n=1 Tax=Datura stramonium TaxID=4076 RepID=A0ABS8V523_DATST|nr:hypothetical protein [Datura stramonium]
MERCLKYSKSSGEKLERKDVEKNRRNHMKNLCNQLYSMLPSTHASNSKETIVAVVDQVDAAVNYIESLKMNLEENKKHLEELKMGPKNSQSLDANTEPGPSTTSPPHIEFHEMGPNMVVVLITGLNNIATFNNIIRLCQEEGVEVMSTNFSLNGNSALQISHETKVEINKSSTMEFGATTLCAKMKELIYGPISCNNDVESNLHLWDYIIESELIEFHEVELSPIPSHMQNVYETPSFF